MYQPISLARLITLLVSACMLTGCLGGTIAQQIARTIATSAADSVVANAMGVQDRQPQQPSTNGVMVNTNVDPYRNAMLNMEFSPVTAVQEPLPDYPQEEQEIPIVILNTSPLVPVELFNLIIGEEKIALLEKARLTGALNLPAREAWKDWDVATGMIKTGAPGATQLITFLIPPEFGKLPSGSSAMVELASQGNLHIARYKAQ